MSPVRRLAPLVAVLGLVALPLVARAATTHQVAVGDEFYNPAQLQIEAGDTVRWTNRGLKTHSVTFSGEKREDTTLLPGQPRTTEFDTPGTYRYRCEFHPEVMQGSLVVRTASSSSTSTTRATTTSTTQDARGSAITAPPDTSTTTTKSTTTTTVVEDTTTTTTSTMPGDESAFGDTGDESDDVDGPGAVAALLLLATAGGAFAVTRRALP